MSSIQVFRGAGDKPSAKPVVEPILADSALLVRGTYELDSKCSERVNVTANIVYNPTLKLGALVSVSDPTSLQSYRAKITGIKLALTLGNLTQTLTLEKRIGAL